MSPVAMPRTPPSGLPRAVRQAKTSPGTKFFAFCRHLGVCQPGGGVSEKLQGRLVLEEDFQTLSSHALFASRKAAAMAVGTSDGTAVCGRGGRRTGSANNRQVIGSKLSSGEKMAGPGKLAFPHFGTRLFAFSFGGHGLGSNVGTLLTQWIESPCCG